MGKIFSKRSIYLFVAILLLVSFGTPANAANSSKDGEYVFEAIYLESLDEGSSFEDVSNISIGDAIPSYKVENAQLVETSAVYIPVFSNEKLISLAIITYQKGKMNSVELNDELVNEINGYSGNSIALVFDNICTYILCNNEIKKIKSYEHIIAVDPEKEKVFKDSIKYLKKDSINKYNTAELTSSTAFSMAKEKEAVLEKACSDSGSNSLASYPLSKYLSVPIVLQNGYPICWAASVACIGNFKTSISHSAEYVCLYYYDSYQGASIAVSALALDEIYGIDGVVYYSSPSFTTVRSEICDNDPIYVSFDGGSGSSSVSHAVVFIGYYEYTSGDYDGRIRYNNPNYSSYRTLYFTGSSYSFTMNGVTIVANRHIRIP